MLKTCLVMLQWIYKKRQNLPPNEHSLPESLLVKHFLLQNHPSIVPTKQQIIKLITTFAIPTWYSHFTYMCNLYFFPSAWFVKKLVIITSSLKKLNYSCKLLSFNDLLQKKFF